MAKKKQKGSRPSKPVKHAPATQDIKTTVSRRTVLRSAGFIGVALTGGFFLHQYDKRNKSLHDLSAIGGGKPVVVQVHDPSCALCRQLKRSTESALEDLPDVEYRIADLTTPEGKAMGSKYAVGKVTLLLFDRKGKHLGTVQGVTPAEDLRKAFVKQFEL